MKQIGPGGPRTTLLGGVRAAFATWRATRYGGGVKPSRLVGIVLCGALLAPLALAEGDAEAARRAQGIAGRVMSPFCPGKTIKACPSPKAAEWRNDIRKWTGEGLSNDEIERRLQARVPGFEISGSPESQLGGWLPLLLGLGAVSALVFVLRRTTRAGVEGAKATSKPARPDEPPPASDTRVDEVDEVDRELDERIDKELDEL